MPNAAIFWPGSGSNPAGLTSYGYFDADAQFVTDAPKVASWAARRLGYPVMDVELADYHFYDCFEQAILDYSSIVNEFNLRENMLTLQGSSTGSSITQRLITGSPLTYIIEVSENYGIEAGTGGTVDWKMGYIDTNPSSSVYDLQSLWSAVSESGNRLEVRRIFHDRSPAISRAGFGFGDAGVGPTDGTTNLLGEFGWAGFDGGLNGAAGGGTVGQFLIMPLYETLARVQSIEFNDIIRRSQYSFEIQNNKVRLMPMPSGERVFFQYTVKEDRIASGAVSPKQNVVSDFSNAPYMNMVYSRINDVGKNWIRKMSLTLAKETLGRVLSKYESIPVPNSEVRLDGSVLRQEASAEKEVLYTQLRESLEEAGRAKQLEKMAQNEEKSQEILRKAPLIFYIG
jgi:hypothetical protein